MRKKKKKKKINGKGHFTIPNSLSMALYGSAMILVRDPGHKIIVLPRWTLGGRDGTDLIMSPVVDQTQEVKMTDT